jgi:hypothetical protein
VEDDDVRLTVSDYTAGTLSYALDATVVFPTGDGGTVPVRVSGDGQVTVDQGTVLQVVVRGTAQDPHLTLESMT